MERNWAAGVVLAAATFLLAAAPVRAERPDRHEPGRRAIPLWVNRAPLAAHFPFMSTSPLDRGFHYPDGSHLLYAIPVRPGDFYSLGLTFPAFHPGVAVTLFDRWPWTPGAQWVHLPFPVSAAGTGPLQLSWRFGISRRSPGSLVYLAVETSSPLDRDRHLLPHTIFIHSPAMSRSVGSDFHVMEGPRAFLAVGSDHTGQPAVGGASPSAVESAKAGQWIPPELLNRPLPGDLLRNGRFRQGLVHWAPSASASALVAVTDQGLRLFSDKARGKVRVVQTLSEDVRGATALFLRTRVKVTKQTSPASDREVPVSVSICYEDVENVSRCGKQAFRHGFHILDPVEGDSPAGSQKVAVGLWVDYVVDLTRLEPRPAVIKSVAIEGAGWPEWEGWVEEIHLLRRDGE
jgi:hypothetical protein